MDEPAAQYANSYRFRMERINEARRRKRLMKLGRATEADNILYYNENKEMVPAKVNMT